MPNLNLHLFQHKISRKLSRTQSLSGSFLKIFEPNRDEMRQVFDKIDSDKDGKISLSDLGWLLKVLRKENVEGEVREIMRVVDRDRDGFIDFEEFMEVHKVGGVKSEDIKSAFWVFDVDGDGRISAEEVMGLLRRMGENCTLEACRVMVRNVDSDGDGLIDMKDFMHMMTKTMKEVV